MPCPTGKMQQAAVFKENCDEREMYSHEVKRDRSGHLGTKKYETVQKVRH
jgi:hypothetical protein